MRISVRQKALSLRIMVALAILLGISPTLKGQTLKTFTVTYNLRNLSYEGPTEAVFGESITLKIISTASNPEETIQYSPYHTMGGEGLNYEPNKENTIVIPFVTGDIEINAIEYTKYQVGQVVYGLDAEGGTAMLQHVPSGVGSFFEIPPVLDIYGKKYTVTMLSNPCFMNCTELLSVAIPATIKNISSQIFPSGITEIHFRGYAPPYVSSFTFNNIDKTQCQLYVPEGAAKAYETRYGFSQITEEDPTGESLVGTKFKITYDLKNLERAEGPDEATYGDDVRFKLIDPITKEEVNSLRCEIFYEDNMLNSLQWQEDGQGGKYIPCIYGNIVIRATQTIQHTNDFFEFALDPRKYTATMIQPQGSHASYDIPEAVTYDGSEYWVNTLLSDAFENKSNLVSVAIPSMVGRISSSIFNRCFNLTEIILRATTPPILYPKKVFEGINNDQCVVYVPKGCLNKYKGWGGFSNIKEEGDTFVEGDYRYQITGASSAEVIGIVDGKTPTVIPSTITHAGNTYSITGIGDNVFSGKKFASLTIPSSIETIGRESFKGASIVYLHMQQSAPPHLLNGTFNDFDKTKCMVFVPKGALNAYKYTETDSWSSFPHIVEEGTTFTIEYEIDSVISIANKPGLIDPGNRIEITATVKEDYALPEGITIEMNSTELAAEKDYTYDPKTGNISIPFVTGNIVIKIKGVIPPIKTEGSKVITITGDKTYNADGTDKVFNGTIVGNAQTTIEKLAFESSTPVVDPIPFILKDIQAVSTKISENMNTTLELQGTVNLGEFLNKGTVTLQGNTKATLDKKTIVTNEGVFTDETGFLDKILGSADLQIDTRPSAINTLSGNTITLTVSAESTTGTLPTFAWEKLNGTDWESIVSSTPKDQRSALRAATNKVESEISVGVGQYRCRITTTKESVSSTLMTYATVRSAATPEPVPVYYAVTLPVLTGAVTTPAAGNHPVEELADFSFTLTLDADYNQSTPVVKANDQVITRDASGKYTVKNITADVTIAISGIVKNATVGNADIDPLETKVWSAHGLLYLSTEQSTRVDIFTFDGKLYKQFQSMGGEQSVGLPSGIYIIRIQDKSFKVSL